MCSITESALDPAMAVSRLSLSESRVCKKCPSREVAVVLRGKDVYCRECLLLGVQHKMRATLGKHKGKLCNCLRLSHLAYCRHPQFLIVKVSPKSNGLGLTLK